MGALQFSLARLLVGFVLIALALAAWVNATETSAMIVFTLTPAVFLVAVGGVIYRNGPSRAFWLGFVLFGASYFTFGFTTHYRPGTRAELAVSDRVATPLYVATSQISAPAVPGGRVLFITQESIYLDGMLIPVSAVEAELTRRLQPGDRVHPCFSPTIRFDALNLGAIASAIRNAGATEGPRVDAVTSPEFLPFRAITDCYLKLLAACIGGIVFRVLYATRKNTSQEPGPRTEPPVHF